MNSTVSRRHFQPAYAVDAVTTLIGRELQMRYKGSALGLLWAVLNPLGIVLVLQVVFSQIVPLGIPNYAVFVYCGLLPWTWFTNAVLFGATTLIDNRDLVRKPFFPRLVLPLVVTGSNFVLYLMGIPVLLIFLLFTGVGFSPWLLLLPLVWLVQALFTQTLVTLVAGLGVIVRDVQHLLQVGLMLWFYLTPIFYDLRMVDSPAAHWLWYNPMTILIDAQRSLVLYQQAPNWMALLNCALVSAGFFFVSMKVFLLLEDTFVEEV